MKKLIKLLVLPLVMLTCGIGLTACGIFNGNKNNGSVDTDDGDTDPDNSIVYTDVKTAEDFLNIQNDLSGNYALRNDIDFEGESITEITGNFTGLFNGFGFTLKNFKNESLRQQVGLFSSVSGKIRNLKVDGTVSGSKYVGGIVGLLKNGGEVSGCEMRGRVGSTSRPTASEVGGLIGKTEGFDGEINMFNYYSSDIYCKNYIDNNKNYAEVIGGDRVGGIVGFLYVGHGKYSVVNLENHGKITGKNEVGGIFGYSIGKESRGMGIGRLNFSLTMKTVKNYGEVVSENANRVGGIAGAVYPVKGYGETYFLYDFSNTENFGKVNTTSDRVGGLIGHIIEDDNGGWIKAVNLVGQNYAAVIGRNWVGGAVGHAQIERFSGLVNEATITGNAYVGGIAGLVNEISGSYNYGDVVATGSVVENSIQFINLGGVVGQAEYVNECQNHGTVTFDGSDGNKHNVGGVVGRVKSRNTSGDYGTYLRGSVNKGAVIAYASNVGGVAGYVDVGTVAETGTNYLNDSSPSGHIVNNTNDGAVLGMFNVGGVLGKVDAPVRENLSKNPLEILFGSEVGKSYTSIIYNCIHNGEVFGYVNVGGVMGEANASGNLTNYQSYAEQKVAYLKQKGEGLTEALNFFFTESLEAALTEIYDQFDSEFNPKDINWVRTTLDFAKNLADDAWAWVTSAYYDAATYVKFLDNTHIIGVQACANNGNVSGGTYLAGICGSAGYYMTMDTGSVENAGDITTTEGGVKSDIWNSLVS